MDIFGRSLNMRPPQYTCSKAWAGFDHSDLQKTLQGFYAPMRCFADRSRVVRVTGGLSSRASEIADTLFQSRA